MRPEARFSLDDACRARDRHGANCGPGALAGACGVSLDLALQAMPGFVDKGATTEIMLMDALDRLSPGWARIAPIWPDHGIARIQWDGPWIEDPWPFAKLYRSHWVGVSGGGCTPEIFDINAIAAGGWIPFGDWRDRMIPLLLDGLRGATGRWWISDAYEVPCPGAPA